VQLHSRNNNKSTIVPKVSSLDKENPPASKQSPAEVRSEIFHQNNIGPSNSNDAVPTSVVDIALSGAEIKHRLRNKKVRNEGRSRSLADKPDTNVLIRNEQKKQQRRKLQSNTEPKTYIQYLERSK
jgi:hypothetical protein